MSAIDVTQRLRSALVVPVRPGWAVADAIEAHGPDGIVVAATSWPTDAADLASVAAADAMPGAEPIGAPTAAVLLGTRPGLVQRFDSIEEDPGTTMLAGYAIDGGRAFVIRVSCPRRRFETLEPSMRQLVQEVRLDTATGRRPAEVSESGPPAERFLAGGDVLRLAPRPPEVDLIDLGATWLDAAPSEARPVRRAPVLTDAELHALAAMYGMAAFPGVAPLGDETIAAGRASLLARGLVRLPAPDAVTVHDDIAAVVHLGLQADVVIAGLARSGGRARRVTYYTGATGTLAMTQHAGGVRRCATIANHDVASDLLWRVGVLADAGAGPTEVDELDPTLADERISIRRATAEGSHVRLDGITVAEITGEGAYLRRDDGHWVRVDASDQRRAIAELMSS